MSLSIGSINAGIYLGLGKPDPSLIELDEIHYSVRDVVTRLTKRLRYSDENQVLGVTAPFTPTASPYNITSLIGKGTIAWLEKYEDSRWVPLQVVNKVHTNETRETGRETAAVYGTEAGSTYLEFSYALSAASTIQYRLQYDADTVDTSIAATDMPIPDSFQPMIEMMGIQGVIPKIKRNIAERAENDVERRQIQLRLSTWDDMFAYNEKTLMRDWTPLWKEFLYRKRGAQSQGCLPAKSGKGLYGGRR